MKIAAQTLMIGLALYAAPASAAERVCLQKGQVESWKAEPGNRALIVTDAQQKRFKLTLTGACIDLQWHRRLGFQTSGRCLAKGDKILPRELEGLPGEICPIARVEAYTIEMEKADAEPGGNRK